MLQNYSKTKGVPFRHFIIYTAGKRKEKNIEKNLLQRKEKGKI
jgi:hypothetical protein